MKISKNPINETVQSRLGINFKDMDFSKAAKLIRETRKKIIDDNASRYSEYLKSDAWEEKRKLVLKRAKYSCEGCGSEKTSLDVHHLTYERKGCELLTDLVAYCRKCHSLAHGNYDDSLDKSWSEYLNYSSDIRPKNKSEMTETEKINEIEKNI